MKEDSFCDRVFLLSLVAPEQTRLPRLDICLPLLPNLNAAKRDYCVSPWADLKYIYIFPKPHIHRDTHLPTRPHIRIVPHPAPKIIQ